MLGYFEQFKNKIKYIVWVNKSSRRIKGYTGVMQSYCEYYDDVKVIKVNNISDMLADMPVDYETHPEVVIYQSRLYGYSIPIQ